jgi:hypothetical protein
MYQAYQNFMFEILHLKRVLDNHVLLLIYTLFMILITTPPSNLLDSILIFKTLNRMVKGFCYIGEYLLIILYEEIKGECINGYCIIR